jgi:magnesium-transporting ATPase (P-type)
MKEMPIKRDESIISKEMLSKILMNGIFVLSLSIWFLKSDTLSMLLHRGDERYIMSAFFAMFIFTGVFVCFTSRTDRINIMAKISKNRSFIIIMMSVSLLQMIFIYFGGDTFRATPLYIDDLFKVILISFSVVIFDLVRKILYKYSRLKRMPSMDKRRVK